MEKEKREAAREEDFDRASDLKDQIQADKITLKKVKRKTNKHE